MAQLPPPHPDPHPPRRLVAPAGACDAHCHIFGPFARFPTPEGASYRPAETPLEHYRAMADRLGLARAVFVQPAIYGSDHSVMLDAIARGHGAYAGVGILDDTLGDATLTALHIGGLRGARFNFVGHLGARPDRAMIERTAARVALLGWHLVFHLDEAALRAEADWIAGLGVPVVIDHMARLDAGSDAFAVLLGLACLPHVWVKISAADRICADGDLSRALPFMAALADAAPERTLWGTDWPHPNIGWMPDDGDLIDLLALAVPDATARHAILVDNPARLYSFS
ncbi:putative TIM-barrel fold metal-dependent hydrolase [Novosphingobium sp. SG751A]|uniref:amidohydrolase family protein n=1 Tax=Novosphingobium sp. SG751A TaxID=2587000 RepID=UPI0015571990|nr:amidohydrolase family protein [Novosphingobium sp. SG751A]NOW44741.1 putative TIM-barrel fold metal-dependent hydrolase [Novosphingobium sp. SG751A]